MKNFHDFGNSKNRTDFSKITFARKWFWQSFNFNLNFGIPKIIFTTTILPYKLYYFIVHLMRKRLFKFERKVEKKSISNIFLHFHPIDATLDCHHEFIEKRVQWEDDDVQNVFDFWNQLHHKQVYILLNRINRVKRPYRDFWLPNPNPNPVQGVNEFSVFSPRIGISRIIYSTTE